MKMLLAVLVTSAAVWAQTPAEICAQHPSAQTCPPLVPIPQSAPMPYTKLTPPIVDDVPILDPLTFFKPQPLPSLIAGPVALPSLAVQQTTHVDVQQTTVIRPIIHAQQPASNATAYSQGYAIGSGLGNLIVRARINSYCGKHPDNRHWMHSANGAT
jgi:hypothetical protein